MKDTSKHLTVRGVSIVTVPSVTWPKEGGGGGGGQGGEWRTLDSQGVN